MTRLVLVHGRDNQGLDAEQLDRTWTEVLDAGLAAAGSGVVVRDADAACGFYRGPLAARRDVRPGAPGRLDRRPASRVGW